MIKKSEYTKNIITLLSGNTIAQALPIAVSPILTRLYTPDDFGVIGLFGSITLLLGSIASAQYNAAISLPKKDEDAYVVASISLLISLIFSSLLLLIIIIFHDQIIDLLGSKELSIWLYLIPFVVFLIALFNVLTYLHIRDKKFKSLSVSNVYKSLSASFLQILIGILKNGVFGLVIGQIISIIIADLYLLKNFQVRKFNFFTIKHIAIAKRYKEFPIYYLPNNLLYNLTNTLITILISSFFGIAALGFYNMANRVLGLPSALLGNAISQVYLQKASEDRHNNDDIAPIFKETLLKLIIISLPIFILFYFYLEDVFILVFGKEWAIAGHYAEILTPLFFIRFLRGSLNTTIIVLEKQKIGLIINVMLILTTLSVFLFVYMFNIEIEQFMCLLSLILFLLNVSIIYIYYILIIKEKKIKSKDLL